MTIKKLVWENFQEDDKNQRSVHNEKGYINTWTFLTLNCRFFSTSKITEIQSFQNCEGHSEYEVSIYILCLHCKLI